MRAVLLLFIALIASAVHPQSIASYADSLRQAYAIPELGYAIVDTTGTLELEVLGIKQAGTDRAAEITDHFRIGSITKTITGLVAKELVDGGVLKADTRLFDLVPELKPNSRKVYRDLTLTDLLAFRARLLPWTYTDSDPDPALFKGDADAQRIQLMQWAVRQTPVPKGNGFHFSNLSYLAVGLMLERATGRPFRELVQQWGRTHGIEFRFGAPNVADSLDTWGHTADGTPEAPAQDPKLEWLLAAGGINMSLPEHAALTRIQLIAAMKMVPRLSKKGFAQLQQKDPLYAPGWRWTTDADSTVRLYHVGNPGSFLTEVFLHPYSGRAYLLYANEQSAGAKQALDALYLRLVKRKE